MGGSAKVLRIEDLRQAKEVKNVGAQQGDGSALTTDPVEAAEFREFRIRKFSQRVKDAENVLKAEQDARDSLIREMRPYMTLSQLSELTGLSSQRILQIAPAGKHNKS